MIPAAQLRGLFTAMGAVLVLSIGVAYWVSRWTLQKSREIRDHEVIVRRLEGLMSKMKDVETGQRGYLLTGDEAYLAPYQHAQSSIKADLWDLKMLGEALSAQIQQRLAALQEAVNLRREQGLEAAQAVVREGRGKIVQEAIRRDIAGLIERENAALNLSARAASRAGRIRNGTFMGAVLLNLSFLVWMYLTLKHLMHARQAAMVELGRQRELLATTLASIGDAVILTDPSTRITFLNDVAVHLTGWSREEALNQPCSKVFQIIHEGTREPAESPVERVLQSGGIVGLANHTLLIRRDGSEVPIDDSGAPVRDAEGHVQGVVLVFRDFSRHKEVEKELRRAKAEIEKASAAKDEFLATLSHELRTPLTPVLAILSQWEAQANLPPAWKGDIHMIRRNVALEARLIDDLLDLTRISRGRLSLNKEQVNLHDLVASTVQMFAAEIHAKSLQVIQSLEAQHSFVHADPARLQQVMWNILSNAIKCTPDNGRIEIETRDGPDGSVSVTVRDNGMGMSPKTLRHLFTPFEKEDHEGRKFGGLGLGMAISKALMDAHHGTIFAASDGAGKGASFTFTLAAVSSPDAGLQPHVPEPPDEAPHLRILLVEDHADTAQVMARLLGRSGHHVETGNSVSAGVALARSQKFDLLVSDLGLPDGSGLDVISQIRQFSSMPAIALSGYGMQENIDACLAAGFQVHLTKPVAIGQLRAEIAKVLPRPQ